MSTKRKARPTRAGPAVGRRVGCSVPGRSDRSGHRSASALGDDAVINGLTGSTIHMDDAALAATYRSVFDALDEAFCVVELEYDRRGRAIDYRFIEANRAFEAHTGLTHVVGKTARELVPRLEDHWVDAYAEVARSGEASRFTRRVEQLDRWLDVYAWRFGTAMRRRVAVHFNDITERKAAEDALRYLSEQLHALIEHAPIGIYLIDSELRIIEANPVARHALGVPDCVGRDYAEALRSVWSGALVDESVRIIRRTLETGVTHREPERAEVRADRGVTEYYKRRIERIRLPDGSFGVVCYLDDISEQVRARQALATSEQRYRTLFESIDEGFCIVRVVFDDAARPIDYRFVEVNPAFERQTGLEDAVGRSARELLPELDESWYEAYGGVALTGRPKRFVAQALGRWYDEYAFRIGEPHARTVAVLFSDVTAKKRTEHALRESVALLRHRAQHDALTGLPNRILLEDRLRATIASTEMHQRTFALLFIDLDGFKAINDQFGHATGDVVLGQVARRMRRALGEVNTLARIHGDEFVALLPEVWGKDEAERVAQKLHEVLAGSIEVAGSRLTVAASIGISSYPEDGTDARTLLRAADAAMYKAKLGTRTP